MQIKEMFKKPIDRDIKGVIKVGQAEEEGIKQELEEYVVTNELQKHFREFFTAYNKGLDTNTDDMGVWISGFFGSGKSHLLKILSYLISNKKIKGKKAIEYFLEEEKIKDEEVIAYMKKASEISADSILFNIDSKSESSGNKGKDDILKVFLKVFNEMQGFDKNPYLADLERELVAKNKYEQFKNEFEKINGKKWIDERNKFSFIRAKIIEVVEKIGFMSNEDAKHWIDSTKIEYNISIEDFAKMVNKYIKNKGNNHHVVFFVDEIGQYIGENTDLMLNLQTVVEDLGIHCKGKAWVVVTSQQEIDSITKVKGNDFSKIQGRFKTRISLTSADVSEVIKKRILDKNEYSKQDLSIIYDEKETTIKNLIYFDDGVDKKRYEDKNEFIEVYPFIPYQFQILSKVLTSIRQHGASGKSLSEGERSMLAMYKEAAERYKDKESGVLISFDKFYDGVESFLDHTHSIVIHNAKQNEYINPEKEENNFNVNVLKTLFLIKYVKEIKGSIENITTLMINNIESDRIVLKEKVKDALLVLERQTLIQKTADEYIFLSNEEQEVEKIIDKIEIDSNDILRNMFGKIFDDLYTEKKYQYPNFKEYNFNFNQEIDDIPRGNGNFDIGINIITANSAYSNLETQLLMKSSNKNSVFIDLNNESNYIREIESALKIEKFLKSGEVERLPKGEEIRAIKNREKREHDERSKRMLEDALKEATYYVGGSRVTINAKDYKKAIEEALGKLVDVVFNKLNYITKSMDEKDIREIFEENNESLIKKSDLKYNEKAITEIVNHIKMKKIKNIRITLKEIKDYFQKAPYGFNLRDIEWLVATIFKNGTIEFVINGNSVTLLDVDKETIVNFITKKDSLDRIYLEIKEKIDEKSIRTMNIVSRALFDEMLKTDDTDKMIKDFKELLEKKIKEIEAIESQYKVSINYPGKEVIIEGLKLLKKLKRINNSREMFDEILGHVDYYEDFSEDLEPIERFFSGEQKNIWDKSNELLKVYSKSKNYFTNERLEKINKEINDILNNKNPFNQIKELIELNKNFQEEYNKILIEKKDPIIEKINEKRNYAKQIVIGNGNVESLKNETLEKIDKEFSEILERIEQSKNIKEIDSYKSEAEVLKDKLLDEYEKKINQIIAENEIKNKNNNKENTTEITEIVRKKIKRINISEFGKGNWEIKCEKEIDEYLQKLKSKINEQLKENDVVYIEF